jgi:hypothetical protein
MNCIPLESLHFKRRKRRRGSRIDDRRLSNVDEYQMTATNDPKEVEQDEKRGKRNLGSRFRGFLLALRNVFSSSGSNDNNCARSSTLNCMNNGNSETSGNFFQKKI